MFSTVNVRSIAVGRQVLRVDDGPAVAVQVPVAVPGVRIPPRDHENLVALAGQVFHHAPARGQVDDVVLVDHRRNDQHRIAVHVLGHRFVLDQLEGVRPVDHRPWGDRQVLANLEGAGLHHRGDPRRRAQVRQQRPDAAHGRLAAGVDERLPAGRGQDRVVARRGGRDEVGQQEPHALAVPPVQVGGGQQRLRRLPGRQVCLDGALEHRVLRPGRVAEPPVPAAGRELRPACGDAAQLGRQRRYLTADGPRPARQPGGETQHRAVRAEPARHAQRGIGQQQVERTGLGGGFRPCLACRAGPRSSGI